MSKNLDYILKAHAYFEHLTRSKSLEIRRGRSGSIEAERMHAEVNANEERSRARTKYGWKKASAQPEIVANLDLATKPGFGKGNHCPASI